MDTYTASPPLPPSPPSPPPPPPPSPASGDEVESYSTSEELKIPLGPCSELPTLMGDIEGWWPPTSPPPSPPSPNLQPPSLTSGDEVESYLTSEELKIPLGPCPELPPLMVDVEGWWFKKDFYLKELAFHNPDTGASWVGTFTPPFEKKCLKRTYMDKVSRNEGHNISWEIGDYPYGLAFTLINHYAKHHKLYALGRFKCLWLAQYTTSLITDMEDQMGYNLSKNLPKSVLCPCIYHDVTKSACALNQCIQLGIYYKQLFTLPSTFPFLY